MIAVISEFKAYIEELMEECKKSSKNFDMDEKTLGEWQNKFKDIVGDAAKAVCSAYVYRVCHFEDITETRDYINTNVKDFSLGALRTKFDNFFEYYTPQRIETAKTYLIGPLNFLSSVLNQSIRNYSILMCAIRDNVFTVYNSSMQEIENFELYRKTREYEEEFTENIANIIKLEKADPKNKTRLKYYLAVSNINKIIELVKADLEEFMQEPEKDQIYYNRLIFILNYISEEFFATDM